MQMCNRQTPCNTVAPKSLTTEQNYNKLQLKRWHFEEGWVIDIPIGWHTFILNDLRQSTGNNYLTLRAGCTNVN